MLFSKKQTIDFFFRFKYWFVIKDSSNVISMESDVIWGDINDCNVFNKKMLLSYEHWHLLHDSAI